VHYDTTESPSCHGINVLVMDSSRLELPPPEELADWFQRTRQEHSITQTELAERVGLSPSQISRLESQRGGTGYETMYRLQQELLAMIADQSVTRVEEIVSAKHDTRGEEYELVTAAPDEAVTEVVETMQEQQISQLPVLTRDGESIGRVTERDLLTIEGPDDPVKTYMQPPFPEVPADTPISIARDLIEHNEALLVTPVQTDISDTGTSDYLGILTPSDFAAESE